MNQRNSEHSPKTIGFHGKLGAHAHLACEKFYPGLEAVPFASFSEVFDAVEKDRVDLGMIPLENSYAGRVSEIHNLLQNSDVFIIAEHFFRIEHFLACVSDSELKMIREVYSHPQALMQCSQKLRQLGVEAKPTESTSAAAEFVSSSRDKTKAAICSKLAANANCLTIIEHNIEDSAENTTIFVAISKHAMNPDPELGKVITTLLFTIRNLPGSLFKSLGGFATNGVNLIKLESYIPGGVSDQAKFFISIEGHPSQRSVATALEELGFFSKKVKLIGIYYADKQREGHL